MGISRFFLRFLALAGLLSLGNVAWASGQVLSQELDYYEIGDLDSPRATHTEPAMMLMGGGDWVPDAFHWWLEKAGNGHIVILRASGGDDMQQRLYEEIGGAASVQTLVFRDRAPADDPAVLKVIRAADGIFIAGGDQSRYIRYWKGTALNEALNQHVRDGKPIGGTSAGLAILGRYAYGAMDGGSVTSDKALQDPLGTAVELDKGFLDMPYLSNVVTDTHFAKRNRLGRLIAFVARAGRENNSEGVIGIGVDEDTALCVDADGSARVYSLNEGYAWLVRPEHSAKQLDADRPLGFDSIPVTGVGTNSRLYLDGFRVEEPAFHATVDVDDGRLTLRGY